MRSYRDRIRNAYREGGVSLILERSFKTMFAVNSAWWYVKDLRDSLPVADPPPLPIEIHNKDMEAVIAYMRRKQYLDERELEVARENHHWFLGVYSDGLVKGFRKCGFRKVFINDYQSVIELPNGVVLFYESEVDESLRRGGVGKFFMARSLELVREAGFMTAICHVPSWNIPSIKIIEHCGFNRMTSIRCVTLMGYRFRTRKIEEMLPRIMPSPDTNSL